MSKIIKIQRVKTFSEKQADRARASHASMRSGRRLADAYAREQAIKNDPEGVAAALSVAAGLRSICVNYRKRPVS